MKIAFITETFLPKVDGVVTRLTHTIRNLHTMGHRTIIAAPDRGCSEFDGAKVVGAPAVSLPMYPDFKLGFPSMKISREVDDFDPDIVHLINPFLLGYGGFQYARRRGIPFITSYHLHITKYTEYYNLTFLDGMFWWFVRTVHREAKFDFCTSREMIKEFANNGIEPVELWRRGVDVHLFDHASRTEEMRSRLTEGHPEDPLILYAGRIAAEKDIHMLRYILERNPGVRAAIVGDGPIRDRIEAQFKGTSTVLTGFLRGQELASAYASADLFIFPSQTETLGLVALEAMASGTPVIAANAGGVRDLIEDGVNGYLYEPGSIDDLVDKTMALLDDPRRLEALSESAYGNAQQWSWEKATEDLLGYYYRAAGMDGAAGQDNPA